MGWDGPLTHRQFTAWLEWREGQWNLPDRHDYYLMQLNADVRRIFAKNPQQITADKLKIQFSRPGEKPRQNVNRAWASQMAKFRWGMYLRAASDDKWQPPKEEFKPLLGREIPSPPSLQRTDFAIEED